VSSLRLTLVVLCLLAPAVAGAADVSVSLYLQPLPQEAARLTFAIASMSAVATSGSEYPLKVSLSVIGQAEAGRQRLLASGRLPTGSYAGFAITIKKAAMKSQQGEAALAVPDTPVRVDAAFAVDGQRARLFWLALEYPESIASGPSFSPVFSVVTPPAIITDRAGFVTSSSLNTITVFDKVLAQAVAVIGTCAGPAGMALDQYRRRLYTACAKDDEVQSIDVATGTIVERARVSPGDRPTELALTPDGLTLMAVNAGSNSISFFEAVSLARGERVSVGNGPTSVQIEPGGRRAFVFNTRSSTVSVVDIPNRSLVTTISTDSSPLRGKFNARGDRLYVIHERSPYMTVLDPRQLTVVTRARLRTGVDAIAVDNVRGLVCLGSSRDTTVEFYDPNALMPLYALRTRAGVSHLTIDAENNRLYMVSPDARSLIVGRLADRKVASEIDVGDGPCWVAVMGEK
jgi:YVTN family beta-propeller protein